MHEISIIYNHEIIRISLLKKNSFSSTRNLISINLRTKKENLLVRKIEEKKKKEIQVIITRHEMLNYLKLYSLYSLEGNSTKD